MDNFSDWLKEELIKKKWKQADLVRESGLDSAVISNLINGKRKAGETTVKAIAKALHLSPEQVFEKAGILPPKPELSEVKRAAIHALEDADEEDADFIYKWLSDRKERQKLTFQPRPQK